jgi:vancomycin resistance protein YoaR
VSSDVGVRRRRGSAADPADPFGRRFAVAFFLALFLLLGGLYAAGYALTSDRVPREASVAGVDIGGLRPPQARRELTRELVPRTREPIVVRDGSRTFRVDPQDAGFFLDVPETVSTAGGGRSLDPRRMIEVLTGGEDVEPVVRVDDEALDAVVSEIAGKVAREPVGGAVRFTGSRALPVYPLPGRALDEEATKAALRSAFLAEDRTVDLPVEQVPPVLGDSDINQAMRQFARPAMSGGVTIKARGAGSARLSPARIGAALRMVPKDGRLVPRFDLERLARQARPVLRELTQRPRPARVVLRDGRPRVVLGRNGTQIEMRMLARRLVPALRKQGDARRVVVPLQPRRPRFDAAAARDLRIRRVVSDFTTYFPHSSYRNTNLGRAAERVDGTVLRPGELFSLNDTVGERTARNGFTRGFIIDDGVLVEDFGGGVSQVATTLYNAAFFAGYTDVEHHPHSLYFDRYPMGREATVAWGALDLRFKNNTPFGALIEAWIVPSTPSAQGEMHVRLWSSDYWDVRAGLSEQYDFTEPQERYVTDEDCVEQTGFGGFEVDVFRYVSRRGERVRTEKDHVVYDAADTVYCEPPPSG